MIITVEEEPDNYYLVIKNRALYLKSVAQRKI